MFVEYSICKLISNAIICFKKHPRMQNQNPVLHFQKFHQKMKTLCRNSEVHHHQRQAKCIFSRINIILHKAFIKPAQAQDSQVHAQAQGSQESRDFFGTHRPKILKNPKIFFWNYQARRWQSSKKSRDSWESWACARILHFVHRDSWESWACAWILHFVHQDSWESWACASFVPFSHFNVKIFTSKSLRT